MSWSEATPSELAHRKRTAYRNARDILQGREQQDDDDAEATERDSDEEGDRKVLMEVIAKRTKQQLSTLTNGAERTVEPNTSIQPAVVSSKKRSKDDTSNVSLPGPSIKKQKTSNTTASTLIADVSTISVTSASKPKPSKGKKKAIKPPTTLPDFSKRFPTASSYAAYLSLPPEERHPLNMVPGSPLAGVRAFFVTEEKSLSKQLATNMDNLVRLGGTVQGSFCSFVSSSNSPPSSEEHTTHIIAFSPTNSPDLRFKDILRLLEVPDEVSLVGPDVASGQSTTISRREVWVIRSHWLAECCKRQRKASEYGFLVPGEGDKKRSKNVMLERKRSSAVFEEEEEERQRQKMEMDGFHMPESQISTQEQERRNNPPREASPESQILSSHLPNFINESPFSFEDIAVEIDMARNNLDAYLDEDEAVMTDSQEAAVSGGVEGGEGSDKKASTSWIKNDDYLYPSTRTAPIDSDECDSDKEESYKREKEKAKWAITKTAREKKKLTGEKYRCDASSKVSIGRKNENEEVAVIFDQLASWYERSKEPNAWWRVKGYRTAAGALRNAGRKIETYEDAKNLSGIGEKTATKLVEIVRTGKCSKLDNKTPKDLVEALFSGVYGVGPTKAMEWFNAGMRTLEDAENSGRFGISLSEPQKMGLKHYTDLQERIPRAEVTRIFGWIHSVAMKIDSSIRLECMGSYRRGQPDCGDIDLLLTRDTGDGKDHSGLVQRLVETLWAQGIITHSLSEPKDWASLDAKWMGLVQEKMQNGKIGKMRRIDILGVPYDELGAALIYFTGNDIFNRSLRLKARHMGYSLNQRGLFKDVIRDRKTGLKYTAGTCIASRTEEEIFRVLGTTWRPPTERLP